ncbi:MAG: DNA-binding protein [Planctomycetes bacterium]|nr:DNA-binding protein [Planctomycetota bacterium]
MKFVSSGETGSRVLVVVFEPGEKVAEGLRRFALERGVEGAWLSAIGAVRDAELGWFDPEAKQYVTRTFAGPMELVALCGNLGRAAAEPVLHAHAVLAGRDLQPVGGHLVEAVCAVTVECEVRETGAALPRARDERFGLNLLDLGGAGGAEGTSRARVAPPAP